MNDIEKNNIINEALKRIGTSNINILDGFTMIKDNIWYNIYVNGGNIDIDII